MTAMAMMDLWQDIKFGVRLLTKARWFTLAAGTALAAASQVARVAFQLIVNRPPGPSIVPVIVSPSISPL